MATISVLSIGTGLITELQQGSQAQITLAEFETTAGTASTVTPVNDREFRTITDPSALPAALPVNASRVSVCTTDT